MLWLSEVLLQHPELESFEDLKQVVAGKAAAELAAEHAVVLLEMESQPGYHASGRSAACRRRRSAPAADTVPTSWLQVTKSA